jgi:hypothetical protein
MNNLIDTQFQYFQIPYMRVHPGYFICSIIFTIAAFDMMSSRGWINGILPITVAIALPFFSYLSRSCTAREIKLNKELQTITQVFQRFGKTKCITLDARSFSALRLNITISRFPKARLQLHARDSDVELVLMDTISGDGKLIPSDALPQVLIDLATALEESFDFINLSNQPG